MVASRWRIAGFAAAATLLALALAIATRVMAAGDWRTANRDPIGLAPDPASTPEAVVQVYGARTRSWRGVFGVHTWVAVKPVRADDYTVYEVLSWQLRWTGSAVIARHRAPDGRWYGADPERYADLRGAAAEALIPRIVAAAQSYPYAKEYVAWPGPNSNTFTAWILRRVPELKADLPPTAIGKDYLGNDIFGRAPSGSGVQVSLGGMFALTASFIEGLEVNLLGLTFGVNPFDPAIKLPVVGRLGPARSLVAPAVPAAAAVSGQHGGE